MGNQLSIITPERFRDQILSIVLYYVAPKANTNLKFSIREKCTADNFQNFFCNRCLTCFIVGQF